MGLGCWLSFTWLVLSIAVERETKNPRHSGGRSEHGLTPIEAAGRSGRFSPNHSTPTGVNVQRKVTANLIGHERTQNSSQTPVRRGRGGEYRGRRHVGEA